MTLLRELLTDAKQNKYAIPAINVQSAETMDAVFSAAAACKSPVIVALAHSHAGYTYNYTNITTIAALFEDARKRYQVTACLHVDHGRTFPFIEQAVQLGFHSVMIDASEELYQKNIEIVQSVVTYAHAHDVSVEAEIGHVGKGEAFETQEAIENTFTDPIVAKEFAEETGIDALAVAFGTKHGAYKSVPKLDLERLRKIRDTTDVPLVMHGTSGLSDEDIQRAIESGITKVNVFTEIAEAAKQAFIQAAEKPKVRFPDALVVARTAFQQRVEHYMHVCGSVQRL
ncbi:class II fructose-bisphosphate aldolase [Alicyclobacillus fastidiosus]|uniref:Class II fructose-bisphosphate aldolase n=1 Tax=Alicyclobacillus fastidiosus TaxID=392011 RepID=A0ABY6ZEK2_9BACL|nr:class II fructose-bisphosphate aldolase [Alicyclobacillus fastidiosus]WAH40671.1 class II fructose-bisphosphate aldolase [Alicyclobacillus fastidiosus]GMA62133.1 class II aldolase, tagatose bisphosphate family protein [Alicyclobacillus fastidiosus]